jgi:hypothetical protein
MNFLAALTRLSVDTLGADAAGLGVLGLGDAVAVGLADAVDFAVGVGEAVAGLAVGVDVAAGLVAAGLGVGDAAGFVGAGVA